MLGLVTPTVAAGADADVAPGAPDAEALGPMKPAARALYDRGLASYQGKDYAAAIKAFEEGFALDPRREFLFANAQARRLAGDCRGAVPLYQRFLEMAPPAVQASATHIALARCAQQMADEQPPDPIVITPPLPPPPPPAPPAPWTHDRWGAALLATGVVGLAVGGGFLAASLSARPANDGGAPDWPAFDLRSGTADRRFTIAAIAFAGGGALVAAGVARYAWVRHRARAAASLTVVPGGLALGGSF